ncbi:cyclin 9, putative [Bodo saltans]|uniref:Cyclin 9, putative n=1 Tax=Bodo saltans TaxID=75058 RepID=A0A0S4JW57_BODSA|nr:cyclin 9, putative [Bodo saltans]|eukprot:CUG93366.1 cyclin 9, putative [Bodo saltans]
MNPASPVKYGVSPSGSVLFQNTFSNMQPYNPSATSSARATGAVTPSPGGGGGGGGLTRHIGSGLFGDVPQYQLMSPTTAASSSSSPSSTNYTDRHLLFGPVGRKMARNVYNMVGFLFRELKMHSLVLSTSMMYYHAVALQIGVSGVHEINEIVLACACVLLASKVEHSRVKMMKLVVACFAIDPPESITTTTNTTTLPSSESGKAGGAAATAIGGGAAGGASSVVTSQKSDTEYAQYKRMVLEAEMVICSLLDFEFHRQSPLPRFAKILGIESGGGTTSAGNNDANHTSNNNHDNNHGYTALYEQCKVLYTTLLVSPVIEYEAITADVLGDAIVIIAAKYLQCGEDEVLQARVASVSPKLVEIVERELLEVLAQQTTRTQIEMLNNRVKQLRASRSAAKTPAGGKRSRSSDC